MTDEGSRRKALVIQEALTRRPLIPDPSPARGEGGFAPRSASGGARHEAEKQGAPFLGEIPLDPVIRETSDGGAPIVASAPDTAQAKAYIELATRVRASLYEGQTPRAAPRIVIE